MIEARLRELKEVIETKRDVFQITDKAELLIQAIESAKQFDSQACQDQFHKTGRTRGYGVFLSGARWMHSQIFSPEVKSE